MFLLFLAFRGFFAPEPPPVAPAPAVASTDIEAPESSKQSDEGVPDPADESAVERRPDEPQWFTLGSMDAASGYSLLVTINSRGGGVERVEVTSRDDNDHLKYRRVDVRHGYLGYLSLVADGSADFQGGRVRVVGPGTPADVAGLRVGDIIVAIDGKAVLDDESLDEVLLQTEPGQKVALDVRRGGEAVSLSAQLTEHPLDLIRLATRAGVDQVDGNFSRLSCLMTLAEVNGQAIAPGEMALAGMADVSGLNWIAETTDNDGEDSTRTIQLRCPLATSELPRSATGGVQLRRSYSLRKSTYEVDMSMGIENLGPEPQKLAYRLEGPNGLTLEGWWYSNKISPNMFGGAAARDVIYRLAGQNRELLSGFSLLKRADKDPADPAETVFAAATAAAAPAIDYVGVDTQYFLVSYLGAGDQSPLSGYRRLSAGVLADPTQIERHKERAVNASFVMDSGLETVAAGGTFDQSLTMFAGPKDPELLETLGLQDAVYYGWFSMFSRLLANLLHLFAGLGNYALAIILLTVLVRGLMFPLSRKAAVNAQKMQELAPELKKIAEQYKDDMEGRLRAQQQLQKRAGFNPLAGCAPMFLQLPIFIGLYRALSVDIELRQQPLLPGLDWASNLAGPDMLAYWGDTLPDFFAGRGTGWLGPYFNILPIVVVALFLFQQKLFMPPATDEQTRLTQKVMSIMTLMMGLFFFRVPAGLCVYFITSSLWGIAERLLVKKTLPAKKHFEHLSLEGADAAPVKSETLMDRLRDQMKGPEPSFTPPNKRKRPKKKA